MHCHYKGYITKITHVQAVIIKDILNDHLKYQEYNINLLDVKCCHLNYKGYKS